MNKTEFIFRQTKGWTILECDTIAICIDLKGNCGTTGYYIYSGFGHTHLRYGYYDELMFKSIPIQKQNPEYNELKLDLESMGYTIEEIEEIEHASLVS